MEENNVYLKSDTKYLIEFSTKGNTEIIAECDSMESSLLYLRKKYDIDTSKITESNGCKIIQFDGCIFKIRKIDVVRFVRFNKVE